MTASTPTTTGMAIQILARTDDDNNNNNNFLKTGVCLMGTSDRQSRAMKNQQLQLARPCTTRSLHRFTQNELMLRNRTAADRCYLMTHGSEQVLTLNSSPDRSATRIQKCFARTLTGNPAGCALPGSSRSGVADVREAPYMHEYEGAVVKWTRAVKGLGLGLETCPSMNPTLRRRNWALA